MRHYKILLFLMLFFLLIGLILAQDDEDEPVIQLSVLSETCDLAPRSIDPKATLEPDDEDEPVSDYPV